MKVDDVILGAGGKLFTADARKAFGAAVKGALAAVNRTVSALYAAG
jgi:hypothetical protein